MDIRSRRIILFVSTLIIVMISFNNLFSQGDDELKQKVKNKVEKAPRWIAYKAYRQNNTSVCDSADPPKDCWLIARSFIFMKALTTGDCSNIPAESSDLKDFCNAVYRQDCPSLSGYKRTMCEALKTRNTQLTMEDYSDLQFPVYKEESKDDAEFFINIYYGFKNKSESACNKFTTQNLLRGASCNMLFGDQRFQEELRSISQDIFYAVKSKESCSTCAKSCSNIKNRSIKNVCEDDSIKDLGDILNVVWH